MIEILLQAERALTVGLVDQAERLYRQAADADPHNSIAVVGLSRVALERGDEPEAWRQTQRALAIDPENVAAQRLADRLEEVWAYRGESLPDAAAAQAADGVVAAAAALTADGVVAADTAETAETADAVVAVEMGAASGVDPALPSDLSAAPEPAPSPPKPSALDRLLRRNRK
jgi:tetratricopeptide (TPR) repeat protein